MKQRLPCILSKIKYYILLLLAAMLAGCAGQVNMLPTLNEQTTLQAQQGLIIARVINASAYPLPFNQLTISPENLNESKAIKPERLEAVTTQLKDSTIFASPIAAGTYALSSIRAFHSRGDFWYSRFISANAKFGTFQVRPGQVTDLGTIIYYPKSQEDKYIETLLRLPEAETGEVLDKYFPYFKFDKDNMLGWDEDERDEERESLYVSVVQNPVTYAKRYLAPDNSVYFLTKLGVIIKRTPDGEWELDAVDTNLQLTSIAANTRGDLIVGGSEGHLFWKPADGGWRDLSLSYDYEIEKLLFHNEQTIDMLAKQKKRIIISRGRINGQNISWNIINDYNSVTGWKSSPPPIIDDSKSKRIKKPKVPRVISNIVLSEIANKKYITVSTLSGRDNPVFANSKSETFSYDPSSWEATTLKEERDISSVIDAGAIKLGIKAAGFWSWTGRPTYMRYDDALSSWETISTFVYLCNGEITSSPICSKGSEGKKAVKSKKRSFSFQAIPLFKNDNNAVAIANFSNMDFWTGKRSSETKILTSNDGGKTWLDTKSKLPKKYCASLVPEVSDRLLISCNGASGDFYESFDNGANWKLVRQHENF